MIVIDMQMPENCTDCPFAKPVKAYSGAWVCEIKALKHKRKYVSACVYEHTKSEDCPMMEIKEER